MISIHQISLSSKQGEQQDEAAGSSSTFRDRNEKHKAAATGSSNQAEISTQTPEEVGSNFFHILGVQSTSCLPIVSIPAHSGRTVGIGDVESHRRTTRANEKEWQGERFGKETEERGS